MSLAGKILREKTQAARPNRNRCWALLFLVGVGLVVSSAMGADLPTVRGGPIYEAIALDAKTGQVLRELNPDAVTDPASLAKMMTLYLTFEALNSGRLRLDQDLSVSHEASIHEPPNLGLSSGEHVMVNDLVLGIVTKSANDAAIVLAEGLGGSEANFAVMMSLKARQLGMSRTQYRNASGQPDPEQLTTARDIGRLALALYYDFPREYRYFSVREFGFRGKISLSDNHLLESYDGADGITFGHSAASGSNLATSAVRSGRRLIGVVMGSESARNRDEEMARLLNIAFGDLEHTTVGASPLAAANNSETIQLKLEHGIYMVPVRINDSISIPFVLDSGASEVSIPEDVFSVLRRSGTVSQSDFIGTGTYTLADGSTRLSNRYVLHKMAVGSQVITDVVANVAPVKGDPLLGQSFLSKLPAWAIDNAQHALILHEAGRTREQLQTAAGVPTTPPPQSPTAPTLIAPSTPALPEVGLFDKFPVGEVYRGPPVMPDFQGRDQKFKSFRTRISSGIKKGVNFAGRYQVIQFGCGTGCSFVIVADVSTGRVFSFPFGGEANQILNLEYRASSMLIRAWWVPSLENMDKCLHEDLVLKDGDFVSSGRSGLGACPAVYCENGICKNYR